MLSEIIEQKDFFCSLIKSNKKTCRKLIRLSTETQIRLICELCLNSNIFVLSTTEKKIVRRINSKLNYYGINITNPIVVLNYTEIHKTLSKNYLLLQQVIKIIINKLVANMVLSICDIDV